MNTQLTSPLPEQGQIVTVRQRRYGVADVLESVLLPNVLQKTGGQPQHLVTLSSIEDDALGETLQVVWQIKTDPRINEWVSLPEPTGFDTPVGKYNLDWAILKHHDETLYLVRETKGMRDFL